VDERPAANPDRRLGDPEFEHTLRNQIAIVVGYCELLLDELSEDADLRADVMEMHKAAVTAMEMLKRPEPTS
jgi:hypothetical protein